jgi:hypothetical protein
MTSHPMTRREFHELMQSLAKYWTAGDARAAADCFAEDAVYVEPPDRQLYVGREELYRFFGGDVGRENAMEMRWHLLLFDPHDQVGVGEFTFSYGGQVHGMTVVKVRAGRIWKWREYWYASELPFETFVGRSGF